MPPFDKLQFNIVLFPSMKEKQPTVEPKSKIRFELPPNLAMPALSVLITACNDLSPKGAHETVWRIGYGTVALGVIMLISGILLLRRNGPRK